MKKFICMLMMCVCTMCAFAQNEYVGTKFTNNWSVTVQGGVLTKLNHFYEGHTMMAPTVSVGVDKYVTPWLGLGCDARTLIGTGDGMYDSHTSFDAINLSGYGKLNIFNMFDYIRPKCFEPIVYGGFGWGHNTCSNSTDRNYMTYRVGTELNFNLNNKRDLAIVVNPSVSWGDINNGKLIKSHGNFEVTAGVVYRFKNSNNLHSFSKARLYDYTQVAYLNDKINELLKNPAKIYEVREVVKEVPSIDKVYRVGFALNSSELSEEAREVLNRIPKNSNVTINSSASPEGTYRRNSELIILRTQAVADYLTSRGVNCRAVVVDDSRQSIITIE